jgi:hypothetical protein
VPLAFGAGEHFPKLGDFMDQHRNFAYCKGENKDILLALWKA